MKTKILLFIVICIIWFVIKYLPIEQFMNIYNENMIEFTRLDDSLIKKFKIGSSNSFYDQEVLNLFRQDEVIRINIPENYTVKIIYKFKNASKGFAKTIELPSGSYDISKTINNKIIYQIDVRNSFGLNVKTSNLIIRDPDGEIIYSGPEYIDIDWDTIYTDYGYDDYYIYYPSTNKVNTYYYYNYPRYKLYSPSNRINKMKSYSYVKQPSDYFNKRIHRIETNTFKHNRIQGSTHKQPIHRIQQIRQSKPVIKVLS